MYKQIAAEYNRYISPFTETIRPARHCNLKFYNFKVPTKDVVRA